MRRKPYSKLWARVRNAKTEEKRQEALKQLRMFFPTRHSRFDTLEERRENKRLLQARWRKRNQADIVSRSAAIRLRTKETVIRHYSNGTMACSNPYDIHGTVPFCDIRANSIDQIDNNHHIHRDEVGSGTHFYLWLIKNNFPDGYQVLCMNCQTIKEYERRKKKLLARVEVLKNKANVE